MAALLDDMATPGRLNARELASQLHAEPYDVEALVEQAESEGLLRSAPHVVCTRCQTAMSLERFQRAMSEDGIARCSACDAALPEDPPVVSLWEMTEPTLEIIQKRLRRLRTALVLCALGLERDAVIAQLGEVSWARHGSDQYAVGTLAGEHGQWTVAVGETGALATEAAAAAAVAVSHLRPEVAFYVGIAGGRKDVVRGDVAIGDVVADVSGGKETDEGLVVRTDPWRPTNDALQAARRVVSERHWLGRVQKPSPDGTESKAVVGPIATSARVIASDKGEIAESTDSHLDRAVAAEMEGSGFHAALYRTQEVASLVVRGISDSRGDKTDEEDEAWQPAAADHAAAFVLELLSIL